MIHLEKTVPLPAMIVILNWILMKLIPVGHAWHADGDLLRLGILAPIALYNKYRLANCNEKQTEEIGKAQDNCLMYRLVSSSRESDDMFVGFHRSFEAREREKTKLKTTKANHHVRIYLKDVCGFADCQENASYGVGSKLS